LYVSFFQFLGLLLSKDGSSENNGTDNIAMTEETLRKEELRTLRETNQKQKKLLHRVMNEVCSAMQYN
jgi:hypothetical protein